MKGIHEESSRHRFMAYNMTAALMSPPHGRVAATKIYKIDVLDKTIFAGGQCMYVQCTDIVHTDPPSRAEIFPKPSAQTNSHPPLPAHFRSCS